MLDIFFKNKSEYTNQINPVGMYLEQLTNYIHVSRGLPLEEAKQKAILLIKKHFKDKPIKYFERGENGDRTVENSSLLKYIKQNIQAKNVLVPTLTSYISPNIKKSILSEFTAGNVVKRSKAKKIAQKAKAEGNMELANSMNNEQNNRKLYNNALSGVFSQMACFLMNPTAHNTLTSMTRTMTSLSNASNEQLIAGNRYLPRGVDVFNMVVYISTYADIPTIQTTIQKFGLYIPTVQDTVKVLKHSSDLYFYDKNYYDTKIIPYLSKLSGYQLAAICYMGDLYHLRKFNDSFVRNLLEELLTPVDCHGQKLDDVSQLYKIDEAVLYMCHAMCFSQIKSLGKDYEKMNEAGVAKTLYETCLNAISVLQKYKQFFNCFFMNDIFPTNSHRIGNMRRRVVVLSDTDSTCFTLDEWVTWFNGEYKVDDKSIGLASAITYFASQNIVNSLAAVSKYMNVAQENLGTLGMKNEYLWNCFSPTEVSKHYYASTVIQEGNVFKEPELEVKGVHLKNSAVPKDLVAHGKELMDYILNQIQSNKKVKFNYVVSEMINLEKKIMQTVLEGKSIYLKRSKIKDKEAYSQDEFKSPYQRHVFWQDVFGPKYGLIEAPPYDVVKIPTKVVRRADLNTWIESIEDVDLKARLVVWLEKYNKKSLPTIYLSQGYVSAYGIPKEIISVIDMRRIVFDCTMQHRLILGTLGTILNEDLMISEQFNLSQQGNEK